MATTPLNPLSQADITGIVDQLRKVTTSTVTGLELRREDLQPVMAIMAPLDTPLRNRFNRIPGQGGAHDWYRLVPTTYAEGKFLGAGPAQTYFAAGGLPTRVDPSYQRVSAPYKIVGDLVSVSFHDQAAGRSYDDLRKNQIRTRMLNVRLNEEWGMVRGNSTTNPYQWDGLDVQVTQSLNYGDFTGEYALTDVITRACELVSLNGGQSRCVVYAYRVHSTLTALLLQKMYNIFQGTGQALFSGAGVGISIKSFDFGWGEVDLLRSRFVPDYSYGSTIFVLDDQTPDTVNEGGGNVIQMVDLEAINAVDLGLITTAWQTVIYEDTVLMVSCPDFQYKIINVAF